MPPIDIDAETAQFMAVMTAQGYSPNEQTVRAYLACAKAGYEGEPVPTTPPPDETPPKTETVEGSKSSSVFPILLAIGAGVVMVTLITGDKPRR
jgi:hypothetical protein